MRLIAVFLEAVVSKILQAVSEFLDDHSISGEPVNGEDVRPKALRVVLEADESEERTVAFRAFCGVISDVTEVLLEFITFV
jgi:hypothetical protein